MSAFSIVEKTGTKMDKFFIFLKGRYSVMGGPMDMSVGVF